MLNLEEIEARANAATPGPWFLYGDDQVRDAQNAGMVVNGNLGIGWVAIRADWYAPKRTVPEMTLDMEFIAHAREDIPALTARVRELEAALENVRMLTASRRELRESENGKHLLRFCAEVGIIGSITRETPSSTPER